MNSSCHSSVLFSLAVLLLTACGGSDSSNGARTPNNFAIEGSGGCGQACTNLPPNARDLGNPDVTDVGPVPIQGTPYGNDGQFVTATGIYPQSLTAINGTLFWAESGEDALKSVPVAGGTAKVLATRMVNPDGVAFSGTDVIWLDDRIPIGTWRCGLNDYYNGVGYRYPIRALKRTSQTGATRVLAMHRACGGGASDVVVIGNSAFWVSSNTVSSSSSPGAWFLNSTPLSDGTSMTVRATDTPIVALRSSGDTLYWMESACTAGKAAKATILSMDGRGTIKTVTSGFSCDTTTFAVDNTAVYYATPNSPAASTETLWAQALAGGAPTELAAAISPPVKLLSTGSSVVWTDSTSVSEVPTGGGMVTKLATASDLPLDMLFDGTNIVWTDRADVGGAIHSVPLAGGTVTVVYQGGDSPRQLAIDPNANLNWTEGGSLGTYEGFARIARLSNGSVETVVTGINSDWNMLAAAPATLLIADLARIKSIQLSGGDLTTVAAASPGSLIMGLTTDGTSMYWEDQDWVSKAPLAGGAITVLAAQPGGLGPVVGSGLGPRGLMRIAPDGTLFWPTMIRDGSFSIQSVPSAPPSTPVSPFVVGIGPRVGLADMAVDDSHVYVVSSGYHVQIFSFPVTGGSGTVLAPAVEVAQLALDGSTLYWLELAGIFKVPTAGGAAIAVDGTTNSVFQRNSVLATSFAMDASSIYFTEASAQDIRRIAK